MSRDEPLPPERLTVPTPEAAAPPAAVAVLSAGKPPLPPNALSSTVALLNS